MRARKDVEREAIKFFQGISIAKWIMKSRSLIYYNRRFPVKIPRALISALMLLALSYPLAHADEEDDYWLSWHCSIGVGSVYSHGYRVGTLNGTSETWTSYEAYLQLGDSLNVRDAVNTQTGETELVSPWKFSLSGKDKRSLLDGQGIGSGNQVVVEYEQYTWKALSRNMLKETDYRVVGVEKPDPAEYQQFFHDNPSLEVGEPFNILGDKKETYGRVIKASHKGKCFKTYEIQLEINSQEVSIMSIQNADLYEYALKALKSGQKVRVYYKKVDAWGRALTTAKTNLIIYKMEALFGN